MTPARKSKSANKRFSFVNEVSPVKDGNNSNRSIHRRKKLSDMLGSRWSKEEVERFYEAYRKYGKDWKKVGAAVRSRSIEMVEALYTMNKAYLSLPDNVASVAGLNAMMIDHYNNLVGSDSEHENNDGGGISGKPQKRGRGSDRTKASKVSEEKPCPQSDTTSNYCLSLLKKKPSGGTRPRAVGKRTPRVPVSFSHEKVGGAKIVSSTKRGLMLNIYTDDSVEHEVALALAGASQRGGPPRRTRNVMSSPIWRGERMSTELELASAKHLSDINEEESSGSRASDKGEFARGRSFLMGRDDSGTAVGKGRRIFEKKLDTNYGVSNHLDDIKEANSKTEGQNFGVKGGKIACHISRKKSKKTLFSGDEGSAFDALQTLADLSLMMPATTTENATFNVKEKEDNLGGKYDTMDTDTTNHQQDRLKSSGVKRKGNQAEYGASVAKISKLGKSSGLDHNGIHEGKEHFQKSASRLSRKKIFTSKARDAEKIISKDKFSPLRTSPQKEWKMIRHPEHSPPSAGLREEKDDLALTTAKVHVPNQADLPNKVRNRRKANLQKPQKFKHRNEFDMLSNCLSNAQVRRWCAFEWFYSAIDYPWFAKKEFVEYLKHVGLEQVSRLTRVEWGVIRSSLGKPRRLSEQFLKEEKDKLNQYRDSVRKHYTELREGAREGLPTDLARPLSVSQRVIAIHPKTREIHDGSVLTVDHNRYRIQFDQPELGVEFVLDIDCIPSNPWENMPVSLARKAATVDKLLTCFSELKMSAQAKDQTLEGAKKVSSFQRLEYDDMPSHLSPACHVSSLMEYAKGISIDSNTQAKVGNNEPGSGQEVISYALLGQMQAREADVQALAELSRALEKKEAVVSELRHLNDDAFENQRDGDNTLKDSESFKKQYAAVLVQLQAVNDQVSRALKDLRQRNTYHNRPPAWHKATSIVDDSGGPLNSFDHQTNQVQEFGSQIHEIVANSRRKAQTLVDSAFQAFSFLKNGENNLERIQETIDYISNRLARDVSFVRDTRPFIPPTPNHGSITLSTGSKLELEKGSERKEAQIPSELISNCVATLLVIQKCTERQFPPEDVAEILDTAVASLQPCSQQNISVYDEIQKCMGIIRNQILALIP